MKRKHTPHATKRARSHTKERIRPFDLFVALSLLAVFFVLALHTLGDDRYASDTPAVITVTVKDMSAEQCARLSEADVLYFDGIALSCEKEASFKNSSRTSFNRYGQPVELYSPERYDSTLTLRVMGADTEEGFYLDGRYFLARGASLSLIAEGLQLTGVVTDVNKTVP